MTVDYTTADNSAIAGNDYTTVIGTVTFDPGVTTTCGLGDIGCEDESHVICYRACWVIVES